MADTRFIEQRDLVSGLSSATNLMDLNPYEFEQLVANSFGQMGLDSKLTRHLGMEASIVLPMIRVQSLAVKSSYKQNDIDTPSGFQRCVTFSAR